MKKILSVAIVVVMIAALCATAFAVEDYGAAITGSWTKTRHVSRDEILNADNSQAFACGTDPAKTYDVTFPTGQTTCKFWGWVSADAAITGFGYSINNGTIEKDDEFTVPAGADVVAAGSGDYESRMRIAVPLTEGTQMVRCYVFYGDDAELIWQTKVVVGTSEGTAAKHGANVDTFKGIKGAAETALSPSALTGNFLAGALDGLKLAGWYGANIAMDAVGYKIDDGEPVFSGNMSAVPDTDPVRAAANGGPKAMRVDITADVSGLTDGIHTVAYVARLADASVITMFTATARVGYDDDYKVMKDDSGYNVGFWLGDMLPAGAYVEFEFTTPNAFSGFNTFIYATSAANGGCKAAVQLFKDGVLLENVDIECMGDNWKSGNFSKTYPAGTYSARLVKVDGGSGKYVVLGDATPDAAKYVKVTVLGNSSRAGFVPYFILLGGNHNAPEAFKTADAALSSFDRIYVNTDALAGDVHSKDVTIEIGDTINLLGWVWPGEGVAVNDVYYRVNDGKYIVAERAFRARPDVDGAIEKTGSTGIGLDDNCLTLTGVGNQLPGTYTVKVYAYGDDNTMYYMLTINLTVSAPEILDPTKKGIDRLYINTDALSDAGVAATDGFLYDAEIKLGDKISLLGTLFAGEGVKVIGAVYSVDGVFYNTDNQLRDRPDVDNAWGVKGAKGLGLDANCLTLNGIENLGKGEYEVKVYGVGDNGKYYNVLTVNLTVEPTFGDADAKSVDRIYANSNTISDGGISAVEGVYPVTIDEGGMINTLGWILVPSGMKQLVYTVDNGDFVVCEDVYRDRPDVDAAIGKTGSKGIGKDDNCLDLLGIDELTAGTYEIAVYAEGNNGVYYKYADIALTVNRVAPPAEKVGSYVDATTAILGGADKGAFAGDAFELGAFDAIRSDGWFGANYAVAQFGYKLNDGEAVFGDWAEDVDPSDPVRAAGNGGDLAKRFHITADISALEAGEFTVTYVVKLEDGSVLEVASVEGTIEPAEIIPPPTGSTTAIIVTAAVLAIGAAVIIGKKRIAE